MSDPVRQLSFSGGEIAPALWARTDHVKYETGLRTLRNMIGMRHGGVTGRPGTMYVGTAQNSGNAVRLIPFIFNETGVGQSYALEFGNKYVAFYQNGGVVISGGLPYTIVSPYLQADLSTLQFAESADVITITHPSYPPYELKRLGATNWTLTPIVFTPQIAAPTGVIITGTAGATTLTYFVSAVTSAGEESIQGGNSAINLTPAASGTPVTISWTAVPNATYYKIYNATSGNGGYIASTTNTSFTDTGITPDFARTGQISTALFASPNNYPSTVGFIQQRRGFANTTNNPLGFWLSQPGDYYNFNISVNNLDSDAVIASIAGEEVNAIQHLTELKFMLILTSGAEIYVQGNSGVVTPSSINASAQSQYGCAPLRPLRVGDILLFNQALGSFVRDFAFDFAIDGYRGNDITVFSSHLFEGYSLSDWAYQKIPDSIVWAVRSDGVLLSCTYVREQQILAWAHHDFTNGTVENVVTIPENGQYAVYLSIKRVINGSTVRYIERMASRIWIDPLTATYLDCFSSYDGRNTSATTMTLTASGNFQTGSSAYTQSLTLTASAGFFTSAMVGDEIFIQDSDFVSSQGTKGNQIRCIIQSYSSPTVVTVTPNRAVPIEFQNTATTNWSRAVKTVTGLNYLEGQEVSVWADRFVVASPFNENLTNTYIVNSGSITLDKCYAVIYVGLPMVQDFQTLDQETSFGPTMLAKRKRTGRVNVYVYNTRSMFVGSEDPDTNKDNTNGDYLFQLEEQMRGGNRTTYDEPPELMTLQDYITFDTRWNYGGRIFIRNVDPIPLSILAVAPEGEDSAPNAAYKKV